MFFQNHKVLALLPLEGEEEQVYSHRGLTYAGWIFRKGIEWTELDGILKIGLDYLREKGIKVLNLRVVPEFLCISTSQNDYYHLLLQNGAKILEQKDFYFTQLPFTIQDRGKKWGKRKAEKKQVQIRECFDLGKFWNEVLIPCLDQRHQAKPIHSLSEIELLKSRFPNSINLWTAHLNGELIAGTVLFSIGDVIHCQYIASTEKGRKLRALDLLFTQLMEKVFRGKRGFSLGTAILPETGLPDMGLVQWKESFGAKAFQVPSFQLDMLNC